MAKQVSAGLMMYRRREEKLEVLLVHPGGPFYKNKDDGVWSIPKGLTEDHENNLLEVAKREFEEETGLKPEGEFVYIGFITRDDGKEVHAWAFAGDADPTTMRSNTIEIDWPPRSGKKLTIPEVDRAAFYDLETARRKMNYQRGLVDLFESHVK